VATTRSSLTVADIVGGTAQVVRLRFVSRYSVGKICEESVFVLKEPEFARNFETETVRRAVLVLACVAALVLLISDATVI